MLILTITDEEFYDPVKEVFVRIDQVTIKLEHSLFSIAKWEALWEIPFLPSVFTPNKTAEQLKSYAECMIIGNRPPPHIIDFVWVRYRDTITEYIAKPHTATTIQRMSKQKSGAPTRIMTTEVIYYQMITFGIPVDFDKWHFNRLLALLEVFIAKNSNKKMSVSEAAAQRQAINAQRLAAQRKGF
jgi:hypothetical protein